MVVSLFPLPGVRVNLLLRHHGDTSEARPWWTFWSLYCCFFFIVTADRGLRVLFCVWGICHIFISISNYFYFSCLSNKAMWFAVMCFWRWSFYSSVYLHEIIHLNLLGIIFVTPPLFVIFDVFLPLLIYMFPKLYSIYASKATFRSEIIKHPSIFA